MESEGDFVEKRTDGRPTDPRVTGVSVTPFEKQLRKPTGQRNLYP